MKENKKTNAARLLDQKGIAYELIAYPVDENDLGAEHIAESLQEPIERVFKTILVRGDKTGPIIGVVPGNLEIAVTYMLTADNSMRIIYEGVSDKDTIVNMTNHGYYNLNS